MRILIVEDEADLRDVLKKRLKKEGYNVDACENGEEAFGYIEMASYDIIILDIMMPKMDGIEVVKRLRRRGDITSVLMLTARDSTGDRVKGLDSGADDYLVKPFAFDELLARLRVLVRRKSDTAQNKIVVGELILDYGTREVTRSGNKVELTAKEFSVLEYLMRNHDLVLTRDQIEQHGWDFEFAGGSNVVDVYIRYLRKKIDAGYEKKMIHTVRGAGYVLKAE